MNLHHVDFETCADILSTAKLLDSWTVPGGVMVHVAEYAGNDVLIISEPATGGALIIESNDANYGGSIHDHVRRADTLGTR